MKAHKISLVNSIALITFSTWAYLSSDTPSLTAFIPCGFGIVLLMCYNGLKRESKVTSHIAVVLTLLVIAGLIKPLTGAIERANPLAISRVSVMLLTSCLAMISFVQSFIRARIKKGTNK